MNGQRLDRVLTCYRISDPGGAYPFFDATGATISPGRWNTDASPMIYTSEHFSTALLEKLVRGSGQLPPNQHYIEVTVPNGAAYEVLNRPALPGWDALLPTVSRAYGETWQQDGRSLVLLVPSVVTRLDSNVLINPEHPEFPQVTHSLHQPVWWDRRLFGSAA